jgi:FG-GAP-like repeat
MLKLTNKTNQTNPPAEAARQIATMGFGSRLIIAGLMLTSFAHAQARWSNEFADSGGWNGVQYGSTLMFGDINNDSKKDMCARGGAGIYCVISDGTSFSPILLSTTEFSDATPFVTPINYSSLRMGDVNGDHFADICGWEADGIHCALGLGNGLFAHSTKWTSDYANSDGWGSFKYGSTLMLADLNHDGADDICMRGYDGVHCSLSNKSAFLPSRQAGTEFSDRAGWSDPIYYSSLRLGDINGDGKADVCGRGFAGISCALGNGDGTFGASTLWTANFSNGQGWGQMEYTSTIMLGDVDGDGKADLCGRGIAGVYCALSSGSSFGPLTAPFTVFADASPFGSYNVPSYYESMRLADVTGDHMADVCGRGADGIYCGTAGMIFSNVIY